MHYYLIMSENDPTTDPVTLWMNGGPGCTSLKGGFEELGQLVFNSSSWDSGSPKLFYNNLGWTRNSSVFMFESPPGTGFSYCEKCLGNLTCKCPANDTSAAEDNYDAVIGFFKRYPQLSHQDFYITGESYAGIYIPMLMELIMDGGGANLKGAAIGNGCWGTKVGMCGGDGARPRAAFYWGKGLYSRTLKQSILKECGSFDPPSEPGWRNQSSSCKNLLQKMNKAVGPHNFYNLDDFCAGKDLVSLNEWEQMLQPRPDGTLRRMDEALHLSPSCAPGQTDLKAFPHCSESNNNAKASPLGETQRWCGVDTAMMTWLDIPAVITALHMEKPKGTEKNNLAYHRGGADDLRELYKRLAKKYRLWIYNGQEDGCIPYISAEEETTNLGFPVKNEWHPWFGGEEAGGSRVACGYATQFGGDAIDFAFVTVKGAGHEVPTFKPAAALTLFTNFVNGIDL